MKKLEKYCKISIVISFMIHNVTETEIVNKSMDSFLHFTSCVGECLYKFTL